MPVLALTTTARALPRRIAIAVDSSPPSVVLLRTALAVAASDARVTLVHVRQPTGTWWDADAGMREVQRLGVDAAFAALLGAPDVVAAARGGATFDTHVVDGAAADRLLDYADHGRVDLVAVAGRWPRRCLPPSVGAVTEALARDGRVSMLVTRAAAPEPERGAAS